MKTNLIKINDYLPPKEMTVLKVIMYPEKQATVRLLAPAKTIKDLNLKHPDLPECNMSHSRERVLF